MIITLAVWNSRERKQRSELILAASSSTLFLWIFSKPFVFFSLPFCRLPLEILFILSCFFAIVLSCWTLVFELGNWYNGLYYHENLNPKFLSSSDYILYSIFSFPTSISFLLFPLFSLFSLQGQISLLLDQECTGVVLEKKRRQNSLKFIELMRFGSI